MKKVNLILSFLIVLFLFSACAKKQYMMKSADGYLVEMNSSFDKNPNPKMLSIVQSYKNRMDAEMNEIIGEATEAITKFGTQSLLASFTTDAMQEYVKDVYGTVDFAVVNNGGLRTTLNKGPITVGNMFEIYAFENGIVVLELQGKYVKQLFEVFAQKTIEGFSKSVKFTIKNKNVESLIINGRPLDENATYKVVTVDYLAEGNDGMEALKFATKYTDLNITLRNMMINYIKKLTAENKKVYATPDNRIEIKE